MTLLSHINRRRHALGFGIHSPFAYRFVREVLRPGSHYAYYAYSRSQLQRPFARLLYRILIHLQPQTIAVYADAPEKAHWVEIINIALPHVRIVDHAADFSLIVGVTDTNIPHPTGHILFTDSKHPLIPELSKQMLHGHIYRNSRRTLIVSNPTLPFQSFDIAF